METKTDRLKVLIIENVQSHLNRLREAVTASGFLSPSAALPEWSIDRLNTLRPELAILGPSLDGDICIRCVHKLKIIDPRIPILMACEEATFQEDYGSMPFEGIHHMPYAPDPDGLSRIIENALNHKNECAGRPDLPILIGQTQEMKHIRQKIQKVADKDITVLITGETGTGKELIARSIHYYSQRRKGPIVKINCGPLPDELLESEVFGFQKGAFTDAYHDKPGRLEMADGGTLFIDEIGDLPFSMQVKLLQVFEEKAFSRLGGTQDKMIDTRVVAATNANLREKVREGNFRKDLFYRLNVAPINAPPLRERKDDIPLLIHYYLNRYCFEFKREVLDVSDRILNLVMAYHWPGNVRELENIVRRAIVLGNWDFLLDELNLQEGGEDTSGGTSEKSHLPSLDRGDERIKKLLDSEDFSLKKITKAYVSDAERGAILEALKETKWNRKKAAQMLQVSYRTLLNRIDEFGLKP
ncbi:MAG: sigma-54 interaction domain-containing protein [Desulfatiglandales bacterium]